jgi:hypothetical protein
MIYPRGAFHSVPLRELSKPVLDAIRNESVVSKNIPLKLS